MSKKYICWPNIFCLNDQKKLLVVVFLLEEAKKNIFDVRFFCFLKQKIKTTQQHLAVGTKRQRWHSSESPPRVMMADNQLLLEDDDVGGGDDIFVYTGGDQQVPDDVERVLIAENVVIIPARTFEDCRQLIEVEGHNKIKKIEHSAFNRCPCLRRVAKMQGVVEIGQFAFNG